jgi:hypothetical protein
VVTSSDFPREIFKALFLILSISTEFLYFLESDISLWSGIYESKTEMYMNNRKKKITIKFNYKIENLCPRT